MTRTLALFVFISVITLLATDGCAKHVRLNFSKYHTAQPGRAEQMIAPNGVHCTSFVPGAAGLSCVEQIPGRRGVRCSGAFGPNVPHPHHDRPSVSYSFAEIGKPEVPALDAPTFALFHRIARYIHSKTLRFAYFSRPPIRGVTRFIVYDAINGPCYTGAYQVLNVGGMHNVMYQPGEEPNSLAAYPVDGPTTPFPWLKPTTSSKHRY